ncbi:MAG: DUF3270 family protein [Streptococcaceae bacterium]|jgi:hypothetical protein|nr:DUF3270 family protein [Streptococcaceae bacterium]
MEAKRYEDLGFQSIGSVRQAQNQSLQNPETPAAAEQVSSQPLAREYRPLNLAKIQEKKRRREVSFFLHVGIYSVLMPLILAFCLALFPSFVALPIGLLLPLGIILGVKRLYFLWINRK